MKIAMVSEHASPLAAIGGEEAGGQNVYVAALGRALAQAGHRVTVYTRRDGSDLPPSVHITPRLSVVHVPAGPARPVRRDDLLPYMPEFGRYLAHIWSADRPDVVHAHFWMSGLAALAGARDHGGIPVVETFHALGAVKRRYQGAQDTSPDGRVRLEAAIARDAAAVIATSTGEVFELLRLGVPRGSVSVVPCGVDLERFTVEGPVAERSNRPRLLYVGRLVERKGVDTIIRALGAIPKAELIIAGGPAANKLRSDREVRRLRALARETGVSRRVKFLGRVRHDDLPPLMRSADAVVCVPWYEPFGIVPLEAMACGVPVVAAAVGGLVDTVIHGTTGLLVPPRQPAALAKAIRELLAEPTLGYAYGIAGSDRARSRYAWDRVAKETLAVYERVRSVRVEDRAMQGGA